jgi:hypothetical protein
VFAFLRNIFAPKVKSKSVKEDPSGDPVANRQGVDKKPNEPYDCEAPEIRYSEEEKTQMKDRQD